MQSTNQQTLKSSLELVLKTLMELTPAHRDGVASILEAVKGQQHTPEEILELTKRSSSVILQEKDKNEVSQRIVMDKLEKQSERLLLSKHISAPQAISLETLNKNLKNTPSVVIDKLLDTCVLFANENLRRRSEEHVIVGDEHERLKKRANNIVAGDIAWASRNIVSSTSPLLQRVSKKHPEDTQMQSLLEKAKELKKDRATDFFEAITFLEDSLKAVLKIHNNKGSEDSNYLRGIQEHLSKMHEQIGRTIKENSVFHASSEKEKALIEQALKGFKKASEQEDDPVKLKSIITDNINSIGEGFDKILSRQDAHIKSQQHTMNSLRSSVRHQEKLNKQLRKKEEEAQGLSLIDPLTGIGNRRAYEQAVLEFDNIQERSPNSDHYGVIVIDIDHFKRLNDTYGHSVGDRVLKSVSNNLEALINKSEKLKSKLQVFRYGGEEFVLLYRKTPPQSALSIAEAIRKRIGNLNYSLKGDDFNISLSIGVAHYDSEKRTAEKVFESADMAMYFSKEQGRNLVAYHGDSQSKPTIIGKKQP